MKARAYGCSELIPEPTIFQSIHSHLRSHNLQWTSGTAAASLTPPSSPGSEAESCTASPPLHIMFLGSSIGNFDRESATSFLRSLPLRPGSSDTLLLGLDHDNPKDKIELAYNDPKGVTKEFIMNGLKAAGRILGDEHAFGIETGRWDYVNFYNQSKRLFLLSVYSLKMMMLLTLKDDMRHTIAQLATRL